MSELGVAIYRAKITARPSIPAPLPVIVPETPPAPLVPQTKYPTIMEIKRAVCNYYSIMLIDLDSARREGHLIFPRHLAMWLACKLTTRSLPEIGRMFGGRDHTTILHARNKIEKMVASKDGYRRQNAEITELLEKFAHYQIE